MTTAHDALPLSTSAPAHSDIILENEFAALGLHPAIIRALDDLNFKKPTPVQAQAIPAFLAGRDLLVSSQTGSGKTFTMHGEEEMGTSGIIPKLFGSLFGQIRQCKDRKFMISLSFLQIYS